MNLKRGATEWGLIKAMALAIGIAAAARAGSPYLPFTGPGALRVQAMKHPQPVPVDKIAASPMATVTNPAVANANTCVDSNAPEVVVNSAGGYNTNLLGPLPVITMGAGNPLESVSGPPFFMQPAQNMLGMTPQMLATYFQPTAIGSNGVVLGAPFPIGFIPPLSEPDKSSHAEYIIK